MKKSHLAGAASAICLIAAMHVPAFSQASFPSRRAFPRARSLPSRFASRVVEFIQGSGTGVFQPENALDGPLGGGAGAGSTDVLSLGRGGSLTLGFGALLSLEADFFGLVRGGSLLTQPLFALQPLSLLLLPP